MKTWDVFISYAAEDRTDVALPLAQLLERAGFRVWLDDREIKAGQSIREGIDEGLAHSRIGILILSQHSMRKPWPRGEMSALFTRDLLGAARLVPVWHGVGYKEVAEISPLLADRAAVSTAGGLHLVASRVIEAAMSSSLTAADISHTRLLNDLLDRDASPRNLVDFLLAHSQILSRALGRRSLWWPSKVCLRSDAGEGERDDFIVGAETPASEPTWLIRTLFIRRPDAPLRDSRGEMSQDLLASLKSIERSMGDVRATDILSIAHDQVRVEERPTPRTAVAFAIPLLLAGRREMLTDADSRIIHHAYEQHVRIRTFDWLLDACRSIDFQEF